MPVARLIDVEPVVTAQELIGGLVPPPRFDAVRFGTYRPDPAEPTQAQALAVLTGFAEQIDRPAKKGWFRRSAPSAGAVYLDGGFGVGKTHLLASLWHAVAGPKAYGTSGTVAGPKAYGTSGTVAGPKAYGTFVEYTHLVGALGFAETVRQLSGHRLLAVDEFELDDPGDTMLMTSLLGQLSDAGVFLAATSNTLPDRLGEGRFAADDFKREIQALSARFTTVRVDGPDFRHSGLAKAPPPLSDSELLSVAEGTPGATLDDFGALTERLSRLHPSTYGRLVEHVSAVHLRGVQPVADQAAALRWVILIDRLYDRTVPVRSSGAGLGALFTPEMLKGGYRKKYLRATSRVLALAREGLS